MTNQLLNFNEPYYAGVLLLENNKTYGRTPNKKRLFYKCIPDNKQMQPILVPYELNIGFSKKYINKYILFRVDHIIADQLYGQIMNTLGDVNNLEVFYEYQLYCKDVHISINELTSTTRIALSKKTQDEYITDILSDCRFKIQDRRKEYVITIDPQNSVDFDDGFSIVPLENGIYKISVYIANVYIWLEILDLWSSFSNRISTIYLPDKRRTMLPPILSDTLCSLQEQQTRFAFTMDIIIDENGNILEKPQYCNSAIRVAKNYCYEESNLSKDLHYNLLYDMTQKIAKNTNSDSIIDSHDIVAFWMIQMNTYCSEYMVQHQFGIFRSATIFKPTKDLNLQQFTPDLIKENQPNPLIKAQCMDPNTKRMIQLWNNSSGQYVLYSDNPTQLEHTIMKLKSYIHITSPIRRLVDLLNQMAMMRHLDCISELSSNASAFLFKWLNDIDFINISTKNIRKVQIECENLQTCMQNPDILEKVFEGIVFDKNVKSSDKIVYTIFLEKLKIMSKITISHELDIYAKYNFKLYLFQDEYNCKKKIRLHLI
jgi:exoribonuclease R